MQSLGDSNAIWDFRLSPCLLSAFCLLALVYQTGFLHEVETMAAQGFEAYSPPSSLVQIFQEDLLLVSLGQGGGSLGLAFPTGALGLAHGRSYLLRKGVLSPSEGGWQTDISWHSLFPDPAVCSHSLGGWVPAAWYPVCWCPVPS